MSIVPSLMTIHVLSLRLYVYLLRRKGSHPLRGGGSTSLVMACADSLGNYLRQTFLSMNTSSIIVHCQTCWGRFMNRILPQKSADHLNMSRQVVSTRINWRDFRTRFLGSVLQYDTKLQTYLNERQRGNQTSVRLSDDERDMRIIFRSWTRAVFRCDKGWENDKPLYWEPKCKS